jgi:hypothetical protein
VLFISFPTPVLGYSKNWVIFKEVILKEKARQAGFRPGEAFLGLADWQGLDRLRKAKCRDALIGINP